MEAEAAFESAASHPVKGGLYLFEVLALRDLKVLVLDKDGRGGKKKRCHGSTVPSPLQHLTVFPFLLAQARKAQRGSRWRSTS